MSVLVWDEIGDRTYQTGLDKGVLYLPDGSAIPWNGLTSIVESFDKDSSPVYFDGMKINDNITLGNFSAVMSAITYPDRFTEIEGLGSIKTGVYVGDQNPQSFGLSWRTRIANDLDPDAGYKIHILYNVTAIPHERTYATITNDASPSEFEWNISAVPEDVPGIRPTAHFIINSLEIDPWLLEDIEKILYGTDITDPVLISLIDLMAFIREWYRIKIIDNGDGTWTAISRRDENIEMLTADIFKIYNVNAVFIDDDTFVISDS